jgi:hypothetical protein
MIVTMLWIVTLISIFAPCAFDLDERISNLNCRFLLYGDFKLETSKPLSINNFSVAD